MNANPILLQKKYSRVIALFADRLHFSLDEALRIFYKSETYKLMREGVSDLHCMSDAYLADELEQEYREDNKEPELFTEQYLIGQLHHESKN